MTRTWRSSRWEILSSDEFRKRSELAARGRLDCAVGVSEIIFEVQEEGVDGGYVATALGHRIVTQGDNLVELREMVKDARPLFLRAARHMGYSPHSGLVPNPVL